MRIGQNPAKQITKVARPERITVAVLGYIPFQSGYYAQMLDVLKACLESIWQHTDLPYDLLVFDNGSEPGTRQFLLEAREQGKIQYLILSEKNLGKGGAWNIILNGAPGEIIAYADCDALFSAGWLSRSVEVLETFPNVGMVTARPFRANPELLTGTLRWARKTSQAKLEQGQFIPWEIFLEFNLSLGHSERDLRQIYANTQDFRVTYRGVTAYVGASHWQFTAYKSVLQQFLPLKMDKPMGQVRQLDEKLNKAGYLRLMISDPLVMNMSNTPLNVYRQGLPAASTRQPAGLRRALLNARPIKKILMALYDRIFRWYYQ